MFFTFSKLYKWYQIAQRTTDLTNPSKIFFTHFSYPHIFSQTLRNTFLQKTFKNQNFDKNRKKSDVWSSTHLMPMFPNVVIATVLKKAMDWMKGENWVWVK